MNFKLLSLLVILLVCSLTPGNAVNLGEAQKNHLEGMKNLNGQNLVKVAVNLPELIKTLKEMDKSLKQRKTNNELYSMKDNPSQDISIFGKKLVSDANSIAKSLNDSFGNDKLSIICLHNIEISNLEKGDIIQIKNDNGFIRYVEYNGNLKSGIFTKNVIRKEIKAGNVKVPATGVLVSYILKLQKADLDKKKSQAEALLERGINQASMKWTDVWTFPNLKNPKSESDFNLNNTIENPSDLLNGMQSKMWLNLLMMIGSSVLMALIFIIIKNFGKISAAILTHPYVTLILVAVILVVVALLVSIMSIIWAITKACGKSNIENAESELALIKREEGDWLNYQYIC